MNNENVPSTDAKPSTVTNEKTAKRPYAAPKLKQYGNIRELTQGANNNTNIDVLSASPVVTTG